MKGDNECNVAQQVQNCMWRSPGLRKRRRRRSVQQIGAEDEDDIFFDEEEFLSGTIFGTSDNSTKGNRTAGMSESLSLFQSIHVLQADEHLNDTNAGQCSNQFEGKMNMLMDRQKFVSKVACVTHWRIQRRKLAT